MTAEANIGFLHVNGAFGEKWMPETMGSGGGFLDYDNDGLPDIFLVNSRSWPGRDVADAGREKSRLYRNLGGFRFEDVTEKMGLDIRIYGMGCAFADYDRDGDTDIFITAVGANVLLRNDGERFTDVTRSAGVAFPGEQPPWSTSAAWLDADGDSFPDLFVCNYVKWTPETDIFTTIDGTTKSYATPQQYEGESNRLYRNIDGRRFEDVTKVAGVFNPEGKSLGVAVADVNGDGRQDLVVANDTQPNFLYLNQGNGTFQDAALQAGIAYDEFGRARAGMGIDIADIRNDGGSSIAIGNFAREPLSLFSSIGDALFQDTAGAAGLSRPSLLSLTFGVLFADFDLNGFQDLIVANGHIEPEIQKVQEDIPFAQPPQLFLNSGTGRFSDVSERVGPDFRQPVVGRGLAVADVDADGDPDVLLTVNAGPPRLFRNDLPAGTAGWIGIRLAAPSRERPALGATVVVHAAGQRQKRFVRTGSSYLTQSLYRQVTFGLGTAQRADSVVVSWPDGSKHTIENLPVGRYYTIDAESGETF